MSVDLAVQTFIEEVETIPRLNEGGCAIVAYYMAKLLDDFKQNYTLVYMRRPYEKSYTSDHIEDNFNRGENITQGGAHVAVEWNGELWDGKGCLSYDDRYTFLVPERLNISLESFIQVFDDKYAEGKEEDWNNRFDRKHIPTIEQAYKYAKLGNILEEAVVIQSIVRNKKPLAVRTIRQRHYSWRRKSIVA